MYEYKVVPAPVRGEKAKGVKSTDDRFAHALQMALNEQGAEGWDYVRAETLPCEERDGIMSKTTVYKNVLVFRRALAVDPAPTDEILEEVEETRLIEDQSDDTSQETKEPDADDLETSPEDGESASQTDATEKRES